MIQSPGTNNRHTRLQHLKPLRSAREERECWRPSPWPCRFPQDKLSTPQTKLVIYHTHPTSHSSGRTQTPPLWGLKFRNLGVCLRATECQTGVRAPYLLVGSVPDPRPIFTQPRGDWHTRHIRRPFSILLLTAESTLAASIVAGSGSL